MKTLFTSALAIGFASAPTIASETEATDWFDLDREIASLRTSLPAQSSGPSFSGYFFTSYRNSSDIAQGIPQESASSSNDLGGFQLDVTRLSMEGLIENYGYRATIDIDHGGNVSVEDAYVTFEVGDSVMGTAGRFKQPFLRSGLIERNRVLFHSDRTALGDFFEQRHEGLMFSGSFDTVNWYIAAQNELGGSDDFPGSAGDGTGDDLLLTGRVSVDLIGEGVRMQEGAYGASDDLALTAGFSVADEGGHDDGTMFAADATLTSGAWYGAIEIADFDDGSAAAGGFGNFWMQAPGILDTSGSPALGNADVADTTPWAATVSYMVTPDEYEVAARYEDSDNDNDETVLRIGVNRYIRGHDIKWHLGYTMFETDDTGADDADVISLGLGLSF